MNIKNRKNIFTNRYLTNCSVDDYEVINNCSLINVNETLKTKVLIVINKLKHFKFAKKI